MRVNKGSRSFTGHPHVHQCTSGMSHPAFPQQQRITALRPVLISCPTEAELAWVAGCIPRWDVPPEDAHPTQYQPTNNATARDRTHD